MTEKYWLGIVKNGCGLSGPRALKLAVSHKGMSGVNWFWVCWYKFRKAKSYFNNFCVVKIKNGYGFLGVGTLKSAVFQEYWADVLHADIHLGKLKVTLIIVGWAWSKMGKAWFIMGSLN